MKWYVVVACTVKYAKELFKTNLNSWASFQIYDSLVTIFVLSQLLIVNLVNKQ